MKREKKFRSWNIPNNYMYYDIQKGVLCEKNGLMVIGASFETICKDAGSIVMQYTGSKDKNQAGNDVYEGDLFEIIFGNVPNGFSPMNFKEEQIQVIGEVVFKWDGFHIKFIHPETNENAYFGLWEFLKNDEKIVIGNVCENPNLCN